MFSNVCFPHLFKVPVHSEQILTDSIIISFNLLIFSTYPRQFIAHLLRFTTEKFYFSTVPFQFSSVPFQFSSVPFHFSSVPFQFSTRRGSAGVINNVSVLKNYLSIVEKSHSYLFIQQRVLKYFDSV